MYQNFFQSLYSLLNYEIMLILKRICFPYLFIFLYLFKSEEIIQCIILKKKSREYIFVKYFSNFLSVDLTEQLHCCMLSISHNPLNNLDNR